MWQIPRYPKRRPVHSICPALTKATRWRFLGNSLLGIILSGCGGGGSDSANVPHADSATGETLTLLWDPHPEEENVLGYYVFVGRSPDTAVTLLSVLRTDSGEIDPRAPAVSYDVSKQLGLRGGDEVCFRAKAFNEEVESEFSEAACATIRPF
jgi:hypothetical protein